MSFPKLGLLSQLRYPLLSIDNTEAIVRTLSEKKVCIVKASAVQSKRGAACRKQQEEEANTRRTEATGIATDAIELPDRNLMMI